ncbi:calcium/sodium antiporter [Jutongia huaianensis]|uniref:Calcium/sodium antiporter n=1 Tax=Jutongia huaianensis TaxID=2763668 RepID=A0ABR7MXF9_9FIRM|nr:calcium/sodium antiporter [Jutongia huaianensis]MBC8561075.1 calcium/sodium antiporter [Jutongia huaianensis]
MDYLLLVVGFVLLLKGADFFVEGSSSIAKRLRVPSLIIGLTIVAMGTSLPECAVSISAAIAGNTGVAVGNAVGSNIFNLMVVCGVCALFCPLTVSHGTLTGEFPFSVIVAVVLMVLGWLGMTLGHIDGFILLVMFAGFLFWMIRSAQKARNESEAEDEYEIRPIWQCIVYIVGGAAAIAAGGQIVVNAASAIATSFGMSQNLIGLTIVAFGTSLPELATSVVAARKHEVDMALGNVIGSNIFNILFVLGVAAAIHPMVFQMENIIDIIVLVVMSIIVLCFAWTKQKLVRWEGFTMLVMYAAYVVYICLR